MILAPLPARVGGRVVAEHLREQRHALGDVRVVIAGDHRHRGRAERQAIELAARELELATQGEVRDVARAEDVIDTLLVEIGDHRLERGHVIVAAPVREQVHRADPPLVREVEPASPVVREQVEVRAVSETHTTQPE